MGNDRLERIALSLIEDCLYVFWFSFCEEGRELDGWEDIFLSVLIFGKRVWS